jgi:hypothetical protein
MKSLVRVALACLMAFQVTACKYQAIDTRSIDSDFSAIKDQFQDEASRKTFAGSEKIYERIYKMDLIKSFYLKSIHDVPALTGQLKNNVADAEKWVKANQGALSKWNQEIEKYGTSMRQRIFETSKASFNQKNADEAIRDQITAFYGILYYSKGNKAVINALTPFMLALGSDQFNNSKVIQDFKKEVTQVTFAQVGLSVILKQDLQKVAQALTALKKQAALNAELSDLVGKTAKDFAQESAGKNQGVQKIEKQLNQTQKAQMIAMKAEVKKVFGNKTLLYTPGANSNGLVNLFAWVGNLTWGLVNTLLGLGVVIATMVISPLTPYVDFPTFAPAQNGKQIYVDVTGMSPVAGKMSLGLFELDNASGPSFASGHEGAHAVQSAILGPLYLPAVLVTYAISGFDQGFMEDWADAWADI